MPLFNKHLGHLDAVHGGLICLYKRYYYPFGMTMPGRKYSAGGGYRYGFNGKENDKDAGEGIQDYGMRIYYCRLGKFLSVDPLTKKYPMLTPYQFACNSPISGVDVDGLEFFYSADGKFIGKFGKSTEIRIIKSDDLKYAAGLLAIHKKDPAGVGKEALKRFAHPNTAMKYGLNNASVPAFSNTQENQETVLKEWASQNRTTEREKVMSLFTLKIDNPDGKGQSEVFIKGSTGEGEKYTSGGANISPSLSTTIFSNAKRSSTIHTHPYGEALSFSNELEGAFTGGDLQWALSNGVNLYLVPPKGNTMGMFNVNKFKVLIRANLESQNGGSEYFKKMSDKEMFEGVGPVADPYYNKQIANASMEKVEIEKPK